MKTNSSPADVIHTDIDVGVTLRELLQQPLYREWFKKPPRQLPYSAKTPNWRVAVLNPQGRWLFVKQEFKKYAAAANFVLGQMKNPSSPYIDYAIVSKRQPFKPPARYGWRKVKVRVQLKSGKIVTRQKDKRVIVEKFDHPVLQNLKWHWCPYCRRPTRWGYFRRHHALSGKLAQIIAYELRCSICGVGENFARIRQ